MKNKINLLLTLSILFLLLNCSGKSYPKISQVYIPSVKTQSTTTIGEPISLPPVVQQRTPKQETFRVPAPSVEPTSKYGMSRFYSKFKLPSKIKESSGLIKVDNKLWTLTDSGGKAELYQIDEQNGRIIKTFKVQNASNKDWEDLAFDDTYVYIGDFGNNRGNRKDLKIYKIPRASLETQKSAKAEIIHFKYSDQKNFKASSQQSNYDCEAMVARNGKLYLFSKNWGNKKTRLYELATTAGKHDAKYISTFNTQSMVTGASINKELNLLILTTYSSLLDVNVWAFSNFKGNDLLGGKAKKLHFQNTMFGQIEGVTFIDNYKAYLSSESFKKYIVSLDSMLYTLDFSGEFE